MVEMGIITKVEQPGRVGQPNRCGWEAKFEMFVSALILLI